MAVRTYFSTDPDAPELNGLAGSLIAVLDACLVNGYGAKPPLGWTKEHAGENKAAYRQVAKLGYGQYYLQVRDDAPVGTQLGRTAIMSGYESMSSVDEGINMFPQSGQYLSPTYLRKSATADGVTRQWLLVGDERTFYLMTYSEDVAGYSFGFAFGDFYSIVPGDRWNCLIHGRHEETGVTAVYGFGGCRQINTMMFLARSVYGDTISRNATALPDGRFQTSTQTALGNGILAHPQSNGAVVLTPVCINDGGPTSGNLTPIQIRGRYRGVWNWGHAESNAPNWGMLVGSGELEGRTFLFAKVSSVNAKGVVTFETSDTWETN